MPKFRFAKLVRDDIVDQRLAAGSKPDYRILDKSEHVQELIKKIVEEAQEIPTAASGKLAEEIADVQQAVDDLREKLGVSSEEVAKAQQAKNEKAGAFKKGVYIESLEIDDDDEWVPYFRKNADRYPEVGTRTMVNAPGPSPELTVDAFVAVYAEAPAVFGDRTVPLGAALAMEAMFCPADQDKREDPATRLTFMAGRLAAAGSLLPEHQHLLPQEETN
jgi:predicted house-cleaning noncanonical NTP pyrophosphatase (MazG superfamily)